MGKQRAARNLGLVCALLALGGVAACRKPAPPSEPPPLETKPTAGDPVVPSEPLTSGGSRSSDTPQ